MRGGSGKSGRLDWSARLAHESDVRWRVPPDGGMRVPGIVYASRVMLPDTHWGHGFPIGVWRPPTWPTEASSPRRGGFDISCGIRLLTTPFDETQVRPRLAESTGATARHVTWNVARTGARLPDALSVFAEHAMVLPVVVSAAPSPSVGTAIRHGPWEALCGDLAT